MKPLRFVVIGSGYRSLYYARVAKALPDRFELTAILCRSQRKAALIKNQYGFKTSFSLRECMGSNPDFAVIAVKPDALFSVLKVWALLGIPLLIETPAGNTREDMNEIWKLHERGSRIMTAEQYFLSAPHAAAIRLVESGKLGMLQTLTLSCAHNYHGASLIRRYLQIPTDEPFSILGNAFYYETEQTDSRYGLIKDGSLADDVRKCAMFSFLSGKSALYDFSTLQYRTKIRGMHRMLRGRQGELMDEKVRYVDANHETHDLRLRTVRGNAGSVESVLLGDETLYTNPFPESGLTVDETAVAEMMEGMRDLIDTGRELYPLKDALQDAYTGQLIEEAISHPGHIVQSAPQIWNH